MEKEDKNTLITYRLNQAKETISEVERLLEIDLLKVAVNRIYYGIFYVLSALALQYGYKSSKHQQLIGWFNQNLINTGKIDKRFGKILKVSYESRKEGDYLPFVEFEKSEVLLLFDEMKDFIDQVGRLIKEIE